MNPFLAIGLTVAALVVLVLGLWALAVRGNPSGEDFYGLVVEDKASGKKIGYEISEDYKFWIFWNDRGFNGYFCPEPMSAMIDAPNLDIPAGLSGYRELGPNESAVFKQRFFTIL
jgi:aldose 1-epimerase